MFHFISLLGAESESTAYQSLLELDNDIKILIDVGWDETFDLEKLKELEKHTPTISLILLTHPTIAHIGAYAHACKHIPQFWQIPVYATFPVLSLGRLLLQDLYLSNPLAHGKVLNAFPSNFPSSNLPSQPALPAPVPPAPENADSWLLNPPTTADIEAYFTKITQLKYSQPHPISFLPSPITITAYSAGHTLGGTIWKITHGQENIVHAVDWNHSRENILAGAAFLPPGASGVSTETLGRPSALICSSRQPDLAGVPVLSRKKRDEALLTTIREVALRGRGTVLIPTDSAARVLELAYLLEQAWRKDPQLSGSGPGEQGVELYLLGRRAKRLTKVVGRMLEWMDESVLKVLETAAPRQEQDGPEKSQHQHQKGRKGGRQTRFDQPPPQPPPMPSAAAPGAKLEASTAGPFDFVYVRILERRGQMEKILGDEAGRQGRGRVILAVDSTLEWGFARDLLDRIASERGNCILLTEMGVKGVGRELWEEWRERSRQGQHVVHVDEEKELTFHRRIPLEGEELAAYNTYLQESLALRSTRAGIAAAPGAPGLLTTAPEEDDDISSESDSDSESDSEKQGKSLSALTIKKAAGLNILGQKADIGINILLRGKGVYDFDVRLAKGRNRMFPFAPKRRRADEYGEFVRAEDYMRAEERGEIGLDEEDGKVKKAVEAPERVMGRKRKWEEVGMRASDHALKKRRGGKDKGKSADSDKESGEEDEEEEGEVVEEPSEAESSDSEAELEDLSTQPSKIETTTKSTVIRARIHFIDFRGIHDSRSLRMLLPLIKPRKLILVAGTAPETQDIAKHCHNLWDPPANQPNAQREVDIFTPKLGEVVDASVDTNAWTMKLSPQLARSLKWQHVGALSVVHILGRIALAEEQKADSEDVHDSKKQKLDNAQAAASPPSTALVPTSTALTSTNSTANTAANKLTLSLPPQSILSIQRQTHTPIHVGDIKLPELRKNLLAKGIQAEFRGEGSLLCDGTVVVRKVGSGRVVLEDLGGGWRGGVWRKVRSVVYDGLAVVAGG